MSRHDIFMNRLVYAAIFGMAILRLVAIGLSPLGLDVEEAQYWQWSTSPDAGYFTKPPMIAWIIGMGTALFDDTEFGVRVFAPIIQAISALLMMKIAQAVFNPLTGRIAGILWLTLPISAIGGFIISTDSPMLLFLMAALLILTPLARLEKITPFGGMLAGLFTGLAMMAKYAAIYLPIGLLVWWLLGGRKYRLISPRVVVFYSIGWLISMMPNLVWNVKNGFVTARHLSHNANLAEPQYSILGSAEFLLAQMGVVGPVIAVFAVLVMILRRDDSQARFWICLFVPAIVVITVQGYFSDANANWALASWPPALILMAGYCAQKWHQLWRPLMIGIGINTGIIFIFLIAVMVGSLGPLTPPSDPFRHLRAWEQHAADIQQFAARHQAQEIVVFRRSHAAKLIWGLRDHGLSVRIVDGNGHPENHFEQNFAWQPQPGRTSIFIDDSRSPQGAHATSIYRISKKHHRKLTLQIVEQ